MSLWLVRVAIVAGLLAQGINAQDDEDRQVVWKYPGEEGLTFYQRDAVTVTYESDIENPSLWTFCREGEDGADVNFKGRIDKATANNGSTLVQITFQTTSDNCWFNIRDNDLDEDSDDSGGWNSPRFSLSANERSLTTLGLAETTTSAATVEATTSSVITSAETTAEETISSEATTTTGAAAATSSDAESAESGGLSTGAKAGIGAGIGIGVLGLLAFIGAFFLLRRRRRDGGEAEKAQELHGSPAVAEASSLNYHHDYSTGYGHGDGHGHSHNGSDPSQPLQSYHDNHSHGHSPNPTYDSPTFNSPHLTAPSAPSYMSPGSDGHSQHGDHSAVSYSSDAKHYYGGPGTGVVMPQPVPQEMPAYGETEKRAGAHEMPG